MAGDAVPPSPVVLNAPFGSFYNAEELLSPLFFPHHQSTSELTWAEIIVATIFVWYLSNLVDWILHTLSHVKTSIPIWSSIYKIHMQHHKEHYPTSRLLQEGPYKDGGGTWAFGPIIMCFWVVFFLLFRAKVAVLMIFESSTFTYVSDYLHQQYHIQDSWLEKYQWFLERRRRHFYHHGHHMLNMSLGGIDPIFDRLFNTYVEVKDNPKRRSSLPVPLTPEEIYAKSLEKERIQVQNNSWKFSLFQKIGWE